MEIPDQGNRNPERFRLPFMMLGLCMLLVPTAWHLAFQGSSKGYRSIALDGPVALSMAGVQTYPGDPLGAVSVLATLVAWQGEIGDLGEMAEELAVSSPEEAQREHIREVFASHGLLGEWLRAEPGALYRLKQPFVAVFGADRPRLVLVRQARQGFFYVFDPRVGNVLMEQRHFVDRWSGLVLAFRRPPQPPEGA